MEHDRHFTIDPTIAKFWLSRYTSVLNYCNHTNCQVHFQVRQRAFEQFNAYND